MTKRQFESVVRHQMSAQGLTWRKMAEKANISEQTLANCLRDNGKSMKLETLERICEALEISPADIWA